jgi:hypothetical protein
MMENRDRFPEDVHFLSKPITMEQLSSTVRTILGSR